MIKRKVVDKWYVAMEYLPNKFGIVEGPFERKRDAIRKNVDHHHCILMKRNSVLFLMYRKNAGKWKKVKPKRVRLKQEKIKF